MEFLNKTRLFLKKRWFIFFVIATYLFFTAYYMGPSFVNCGGVVNGTGDSTGGPIWRYTIEPDSPLGSYQYYTNYPTGENLFSPVSAVVALQSTLIWTFSKIAGPVCAYNLTNIGGYMASSLVMFGFIFALTRRRWIAWLAGYAFAFTPYFQIKVGGHPGYGYEALLIGVVWAFLSLIKEQKTSRAVILATLVVTCFYWDPYFSLLVGTVMAPLLAVWFVWHTRLHLLEKISKSSYIKSLKLVGVSLGLMVIGILPLVYIGVIEKAKIDAQVSSSRGSNLAAAHLCSNLPHEYLLPFPLSPALETVFGSYTDKAKAYLYKFSTCGVGEDAIGISAVALLVTGLGALAMSWERLNKRKTELHKVLHYPPQVVIWGAVAVGIFAALIALPPINIFGVPMLSWIILSLTSTWRIFAREYVIVNMVIVILSSVTMTYFAYHFRAKKKVLATLFVLMFVGVFIQYQAFMPFSGNTHGVFDYSKAPKAYSWIKDNKNIHALAEYPIEPVSKTSSLGYYLTMQTIHKKPLFNSSLSSGAGAVMNDAMRNIADPQTVPVLSSLGIDTVVIHGSTPEEVAKIPYLKVIYSAENVNPHTLLENAKGLLVIAQIVGAPQPSRMLQFDRTLPINGLIQKDAVSWWYEIPSGTTFKVATIKGKIDKNAGPFQACFDLKIAVQGGVGKVKATIDGSKTEVFDLTDSFTTIRLSAFKTIKLEHEKGHNTQITKLGCVN